MSLSKYHQKYSVLADAEIEKRGLVKADEYKIVFESTSSNNSNPFRVAVLGCADKRLLSIHERIFQALLGREVQVLTFDVTIDHLKGAKNVVRHDCTLPLPNGPFDFVTSHVLLKFIPKEKQFLAIKNAHDALAPGGSTAHILDHEDLANSDVDIAMLKKMCQDRGIGFKTINLPLGIAFVTMDLDSH